MQILTWQQVEVTLGRGEQAQVLTRQEAGGSEKQS